MPLLSKAQDALSSAFGTEYEALGEADFYLALKLVTEANEVTLADINESLIEVPQSLLSLLPSKMVAMLWKPFLLSCLCTGLSAWHTDGVQALVCHAAWTVCADHCHHAMVLTLLSSHFGCRLCNACTRM